jgi:hypothetical protein
MARLRLRLTIGILMTTIALLGMVFAGIALAVRPAIGRLAVTNHSGQPIARLAVTVSGEQWLVTDLADGATTMVSFAPHLNERFSFSGKLRNGSRVGGRFAIAGDPRRFEWIGCIIGPEGKVRPALVR